MSARENRAMARSWATKTQSSRLNSEILEDFL